jgi:hypothetical protein
LLAPIEPFSVDALRDVLAAEDAKSDPKTPSLVDLLELELQTLDPTWLQALSDECVSRMAAI